MSTIDNENVIGQIMNIERLLSIAFPAVAVYQHFSSTESVNMLFRCVMISVLLMIILTIYTVWVFLQAHLKESPRRIVDIAIPMLVALSAVMLTGMAESQYKFLFFFVIISSAIECERTESISISIITGALVLSIDIIFAGAGPENYFESDIILAFVFFIIAWTISYYVEYRQKYIYSLRDKSTTDGLTGLKNHRYFYDNLERILSEIQKNGEQRNLSLLFLDIDDFKCYNDLYGHQRGDEALRIVSGLISEQFPEPIIVSRYGGEEFAVLLPDISEAEACEKAEKLRKCVHDYHFIGEEALPRKSLTISIGVSSYPDRASTGTDLVKNADEACYRAKFLYKNRVETYYSPLNEPNFIKSSLGSDTIASIKTLIAVIDSKDRYTFGHVERVVFFSTLFAEKLNFSDEEKRKLIFAAYLHDIGKINISKEILMKTDPLTEEEWEILKTHPQNAEEILSNIPSLQELVPIILQHHERFDGTGYPNRLAGNEITYLARVLTVIDSFDAMTSMRPYQSRKTFSQAVEELKRCSGTQFDPEIVHNFVSAISPMLELNIDSSENLPMKL